MSACNHFQKIKTEKIGNLIKSTTLTECQNPQHTATDVPQSDDLWFCLECGYVGCSRSSELACSLKHFDVKKPQHSVSINPITLVIWCYTCDRTIDEALEFCSNQAQRDKLTQFKEKITQQFWKANKELQKANNTVIVVPDNTGTKGKTTAPTQQSAPEKSDNQPPQTNKAVFGLKNIGNTCFFNSVMQCLNATKPLIDTYMDLKTFDVSDLKEDPEDSKPSGGGGGNGDWITVENPKQSNQKKGKGSQKGQKGKNNSYTTQSRSSFINICKNFQDFLIGARGKKDHIYDPTPLFSSIAHLFANFRGYSQQDAQELLRNFLDGLSTCEEKRYSKTQLAQSRKNFKHRLTEIERIFGSYLCNYIKCHDCKYVNRTFDFCLDIVLNIDREKPKIVQPRIVEPPKSKKGKKKNKAAKNEEVPVEEVAEVTEEPATEEPQEEEKKEQEVVENQQPAAKYNLINPDEIKETVIPYFDRDLYDLYEPNTGELTKDIKVSDPGAESITIEEALKDFTAVEILNRQKNFYKCENCEKENKLSSGSDRRFFLYSPPLILTLVLKRYRQIGIGRFEKVNTQVKFSETIDLDPYVLLPVRKSKASEVEEHKSEFVYDLYGLVVQSGNLNGGHYVSYTKHIINGEEFWFYHSDTNFRAVSKETVFKTQPYILFYSLRRRPDDDSD